MKFKFKSDAGVDGTKAWSADLPTVRDAQIEAIKTLGELLREDGSEFWRDQEVSMTVSDAEGLVLFRLDLSAVIAPAPYRPLHT